MTLNVIRIIIHDVKEKFKDPIKSFDFWDKQEILKRITYSNFSRLKLILSFTLIVSSLLLFFDTLSYNNWAKYGILPLYIVCDITLFIVSILGLYFTYKKNFISVHKKNKIVLFFMFFGITWTGIISAPPTFESYFAFLFGILLISGTFILQFTYRILLIVLIYSIFCITRLATDVGLYSTISDFALIPMELLLSVIVSTIVYKVKVESIAQKLKLTNTINTLELELTNNKTKITKKTQQLKNQIEENSLINMQLNTSNELHNNLLSQISESVIIIDNSLNIREWNSTIENISGLTKKMVINKNFISIWSKLINKNDKYNENYNIIKQYLNTYTIGLTTKHLEIKHWLKAKNNSIYVLVKFTPIKLQNNFRILINCTDISYKQKYLQILQNEKEEIVLSNKHKSIFFLGINNNIIYPLKTTNSYLQKVKQLTDNKEANNYIELIKNNHNKLNQSIAELIEYSEIESKNIKLSNSTFTINQLLNAIEPLLINYNKNNVTLINNFSDSTMLIQSDKLKLVQIFINLINNALKFTDSGSVTFGYSISNNSFYGFVKDTGIGIQFYELEKIFEPFYCANNINPNNKANGLGLAIVKGYLEILGGNIITKSNTNKGTEFEFDIPIKTIKTNHKKNKNSCIIIDNSNETYDIIYNIVNKFYSKVFRTYDCQSSSHLINNNDIEIVFLQLFSKSGYGWDISKCLKQKFIHQKIVAISFQPLNDDILSLSNSFDEILYFENEQEFTNNLIKLINAKQS